MWWVAFNVALGILASWPPHHYRISSPGEWTELFDLLLPDRIRQKQWGLLSKLDYKKTAAAVLGTLIALF